MGSATYQTNCFLGKTATVVCHDISISQNWVGLAVHEVIAGSKYILDMKAHITVFHNKQLPKYCDCRKLCMSLPARWKELRQKQARNPMVVYTAKIASTNEESDYQCLDFLIQSPLVSMLWVLRQWILRKIDRCWHDNWRRHFHISIQSTKDVLVFKNPEPGNLVEDDN